MRLILKIMIPHRSIGLNGVFRQHLLCADKCSIINFISGNNLQGNLQWLLKKNRRKASSLIAWNAFAVICYEVAHGLLLYCWESLFVRKRAHACSRVKVDEEFRCGILFAFFPLFSVNFRCLCCFSFLRIINLCAPKTFYAQLQWNEWKTWVPLVRSHSFPFIFVILALMSALTEP